MSQRSSVLYNLINNPLIYRLIQKLMSGTSFRKKIVQKNIKNKKFKILDIGCGPAEILDYIPECEYYGYDIDKRSINDDISFSMDGCFSLHRLIFTLLLEKKTK